MRKIIKLLTFTTFIFLFSISIFAQTSTLSGTITNEIDGALVVGVRVEIADLNLNAESDENGRYEFKNIPYGKHRLITHIEGYADKVKTITVSSSEATLDFVIGIKALSAEVTVTASGQGESVFESFSSVNSVPQTRISEKASVGLGDVLENEAGVSNRSFGSAGTSRPSIRSFEGDRVFVAQDGVRTGSLGAASGDHGEPISPFGLERIEIIKGPATLLYGSNAIGGVVNAITNDEFVSHPGVRGFFSTFGGTVDKQAGLAGGIEYGHKNNLFGFNTSVSHDSDFETPLGKIPNSGAKSFNGSGSYGYFSDKYFGRGTVTFDRRRYGIPYAPLFESREILSIINGGIDCTGDPSPCQFDVDAIKSTFANQLPSVPEEEIDIKMRRNNYRFIGGFRDFQSPITAGTFSLDFTDYRHEEIEAEDGIETVATAFDNDVFSYRSVFKQQKYKNLSGQFGFDGYRRSFLTVGAESLVDGRVRQNNFAAFTLQEVSIEKLSLQFGGRIETNRYNPVNNNLPDLSFTGFSGSIGTRYEVWKGGAIIGSFSSSYRSPSLEELYNFGPHVGTVTFEQGNLGLERERSNGVELSFRQNSNRVRFNGSFFYNNIDNFVFGSPADEDNDGNIDVEDGLPVVAFTQSDARYYGADASLEVDLNKYVGAYFVGDIVNAELTSFGFAPPRITPARARFGLDLKYKALSLRPEILFVSSRDSDIFPLETSTDGYTLLNLNGSYVIATGHAAHIITFGGQNLTDKLYRNHVNFLKDLVPSRGRGLKVSYTVRFF